VNGTENPYRDPRSEVVTGTGHVEKRVFLSESAYKAARCGEKGWLVVMQGDINIARSTLDGFLKIGLRPAYVKNRQDFETKLMDQTGLAIVDRKYSYRLQGIDWGASGDRVDMVLLSQHALLAGRPVLVGAAILDDELERGPSDHVPLYATMSMEHGLDVKAEDLRLRPQ
jgi:exonuclease III